MCPRFKSERRHHYHQIKKSRTGPALFRRSFVLVNLANGVVLTINRSVVRSVETADIVVGECRSAAGLRIVAYSDIVTILVTIGAQVFNLVALNLYVARVIQVHTYITVAGNGITLYGGGVSLVKQQAGRGIVTGIAAPLIARKVIVNNGSGCIEAQLDAVGGNQSITDRTLTDSVIANIGIDVAISDDTGFLVICNFVIVDYNL